MPKTSRRSSNCNAIEINNNNATSVQETVPTAVNNPLTVSIPEAKAAERNGTLAQTPKDVGTDGVNSTVTTSSSSNEQRHQSKIANIKLISLVKRRPWLYDSSHSKYAKKHLIEKTWAQIGRICDESGAICKERWRNIRAAFARSINIYKTQSGPNRLKPYYLHRELQFLINPMTKGRKTQTKLEDSPAEDGSCEEHNDQSVDNNAVSLMDYYYDNDGYDDHNDKKVDNNVQTGKEELSTVNDKEIPETCTSSVINIDGITAVNNSAEINSSTISACENDNSNGTSRANSTDIAIVSDAEADFDADADADATDDDFTMDDSMFMHISNNTPERNRVYNCSELSAKLSRMKKERFENIPDDADLLFVKSLYYDMNKLDTSQKIRLKKQIYEALEQISHPIAEATVPTTSAVSETSATSSMPAASPISFPSPLTATQKQSLCLVRSLNDTKLQHLNRFIKYVLEPNLNDSLLIGSSTRISNTNANMHAYSSLNIPATGARSTDTYTTAPMSVFPVHIPNPTRMQTTNPEGSNGILTYPFTVKEESFDEFNILYAPSQ